MFSLCENVSFKQRNPSGDRRKQILLLKTKILSGDRRKQICLLKTKILCGDRRNDFKMKVTNNRQ